jgi:hypothetical protein
MSLAFNHNLFKQRSGIWNEDRESPAKDSSVRAIDNSRYQKPPGSANLASLGKLEVVNMTIEEAQAMTGDAQPYSIVNVTTGACFIFSPTLSAGIA